MKDLMKKMAWLSCVLTLSAAAACDKQEPANGEEPASATAPEEHADEQVDEQNDEHAADEAHDSADGERVGQSPTSLEELPEGVNVVQNEMQLLTEAMQTTLLLIANDQLEGIPAQIKKVHPAKLLTHEAIEKGVYAPPKNSEKLDDFVELDDAFHDDLRGLLKASQTDDLQMATEKYGDLVQGCTTCHTQFRY